MMIENKKLTYVISTEASNYAILTENVKHVQKIYIQTYNKIQYNLEISKTKTYYNSVE